MNSEVCIIIPIYNEGQAVRKVVAQILKTYPVVICVNDGSTDNSLEQIQDLGVLCISHGTNLGQGAALQTGVEYARSLVRVKYFVTFDADGQHSVKDVQKMVSEIKKGKVDIILGSRFLGGTNGMHGSKKLVLKSAVWFTNAYSRLHLTDTHNGLRVFNRDFANHLDIQMPGYSHASEIIDSIRSAKWRYKELPVHINYSPYSSKKGQSLLNSISIIVDLILYRRQRND